MLKEEKMNLSDISVNTQSSIKIKADRIIYADPLDITEEKHDADYIFITHDHYDHMSPADILKIIKENTTIVIPSAAKNKLLKELPDANLLTVDPGQSYTAGDLSFDTVPAYNKLKPFHPKRDGWVGYILDIDGTRIYIAGDTDATKEAESVKCDIALIPIGGTYTMNYKEAAALINKIRPKYAIPTHYGSLVGKAADGTEFKKLVDSDITVELKLKIRR